MTTSLEPPRGCREPADRQGYQGLVMRTIQLSIFLGQHAVTERQASLGVCSNFRRSMRLSRTSVGMKLPDSEMWCLVLEQIGSCIGVGDYPV
jgi:hypothetical protein